MNWVHSLNNEEREKCCMNFFCMMFGIYRNMKYSDWLLLVARGERGGGGDADDVGDTQL